MSVYKGAHIIDIYGHPPCRTASSRGFIHLYHFLDTNVLSAVLCFIFFADAARLSKRIHPLPELFGETLHDKT